MQNTPPQQPSRPPSPSSPQPSWIQQQSPVVSRQPYAPPQSSMPQQQSPKPWQPPKRKRVRAIKWLSGTRSVVAAIAAILAILQFFGIKSIWSFVHQPTPTPQPRLTPKPTSTPIPLPLIAESNHTEASPACEYGLPHDLAWYVYHVNVTCLPDNSGTKIDQTTNSYEPILGLRPADDQHRFASNYSTGVTLTHLAPNVCAGFFIGVTTKLAQDFLFLICGNGNWYISRTGTSGLPYVISQNTSTTKEPASDHSTIEVAVVGSSFQMFVSGGTRQVHSGQDPELTKTQVIGIVFGEEGAVISNTNSTFLTSITAKDFYYEQGPTAHQLDKKIYT